MDNSLLLLHISDIHFQEPLCNTAMDPDLPYRTALVTDLETHRRDLGDVETILVTGDIAFHGWESEYTTALVWIKKVAKACGCPIETIFVVPGNHDVDRTVISNKASVRNIHKAVLTLDDPEKRDKEFLTQLLDPEVGKVMLDPMQDYNKFAAKFECELYLSERLFWTKNLPFGNGFTLRIYGLTSTVFSGVNGKDDGRYSLYLSPYQTVFDPEAGVIALAMCHHPPEYFLDQDAMDEALCNRATVHLLGHKHRQRASKDDRYVRFSSGAVIPDHYEAGWEPGYNLLRLTVETTEDKYFLVIEGHVFVWQTNPDRFRLKEFADGSTVFRHTIPLMDPPARDGLTLEKDRSEKTQKEKSETGRPVDLVSPSFGGMETEMNDMHTRNLVFRFWELSSSQRRDIVQSLNLVEKDDFQLPEPERYSRAFQKAKQNGLIEQLADKITEMEKRQ